MSLHLVNYTLSIRLISPVANRCMIEISFKKGFQQKINWSIGLHRITQLNTSSVLLSPEWIWWAPRKTSGRNPWQSITTARLKNNSRYERRLNRSNSASLIDFFSEKCRLIAYTSGSLYCLSSSDLLQILKLKREYRLTETIEFIIYSSKAWLNCLLYSGDGSCGLK